MTLRSAVPAGTFALILVGFLLATGGRAQEEEVLGARGLLEQTHVAGDTRLRERSWIRAIAASPDGRGVAAATDSSITRWDASTGFKTWSVATGASKVVALGDVAAAIDREGKILVLDTSTGQEIARRKLALGSTRLAGLVPVGPDRLAAVAYTGRTIVLDARTLDDLWQLDFAGLVAADPEGRYLIVARGNRLHVLDVRERKYVEGIASPDPAIAVCWAADGSRFWTGHSDGTIRRWAAGEWRLLDSTELGKEGQPEAMSLGPDHVAWIDARGTIRVRSLAGGPVVDLGESPGSGGKAPLAWVAGDLAIAWGCGVRIVDPASGRDRFDSTGHFGPVSALALAPDGKTFASAGGTDGTIRILDLEAADQVSEIQVAAGQVNFLAYDPGGRGLLAAVLGVGLWDSWSGEGGRPGPRPHRIWGTTLALSPDGRFLLVAAQTGSDAPGYALHDLETGASRPWERPLSIRPSAEFPGVVWLGGSERAATSGRGVLCVHEAPGGRVTRTAAGRDSYVWRLAAPRDGSWLASNEGRGFLVVRDPDTLGVLRERSIGGPLAGLFVGWEYRGLSVDPEGREIATLAGDLLALWDARTLDLLDLVPVPGTPWSLLHAGSRVLVGCMDSAVRIYRRRLEPRLPEGGGALPAILEESRALRDEYTVVWERWREAAMPPRDLASQMQLGGRMNEIVARVFFLSARAIAFDPGSALARAGLAWVWLLQGDLDQAEPEIDRAAALDPELPLVFSLRAHLHHARHQYEAALAELDRCDAAGHRREWSRRMRADVLYGLERFEESASLYGELVDAGAGWLTSERDRARRLAGQHAEELARREAEARQDDLPRVELATSRGRIVLELFEDDAPNTVASFLALVEAASFDGTPLDPQGDEVLGGGEADFAIRAEVGESFRRHFAGTISSVGVWPIGQGRRFRIALAPGPDRDGRECVFGRIVEGLDVARSLRRGDALVTAHVTRKRDHPYEPRRIPTGE